MALHWNVKDVKDWEKKAEDKYLGAIRESLIWWSLHYQIPTITEKSVEEVWFRLQALDRVFGGEIMHIEWGQHDDEHDITLDDVKAWIGLHTNTSNCTNKQFDKYLGELMRRHLTHN